VTRRPARESIDRRSFLKSALLALTGSSIIRLARGANVIPGADRKNGALFSFVQINDLHIDMPDGTPPAYEKANEKARHVIETINAERKFKLPDFVILPGDIIHGETLESLLPECALAKKMLSELRCPYYTLVGNHEVIQREGDPRFQGPYEKVFGANRVNYHFTHKGILFICVNNSGAKGQGNKVSKQRNAWLADVLHTHPDMPKIVACHIPMVSLREEPILKKSFGFSTYKMLGTGTWDIIRKERETVIAVLCGHLHLTAAAEVDGIMHVCPSGTASYPCDYAHFTVHRDRIDAAMHRVAKDLVTPSTNIHGRRRHKRDFTDDKHATPEEYVAGTEAERKFTISLPARSRPRKKRD